MSQIVSLANLFARYRIYPKNSFSEKTTARIFQQTQPYDHYARDLDQFLALQQYDKEKRGADLPWWGKDFFLSSQAKVMLISSDSLAKDAGSIVFHACFMPTMDEAVYKRFRDEHNLEKFRSYGRAKNLLSSVSQLESIYLTDGAKVYKHGSRKYFDEQQSRQLLEEEIELCNPHLIILLGSSPLELLRFEENYADVVGKRILNRAGRPFIVAPFPSVANQKYYQSRFDNTVQLVKSFWSRK